MLATHNNIIQQINKLIHRNFDLVDEIGLLLLAIPELVG
jgi:hypothetical protein